MNKLLSLNDKQELAGQFHIELEALLSVLTVEARDCGFLQSGKPKILFEANYFHRLTNGIYDSSHPNISSPIWNKSLYKGGEGEWERLSEAMELNKQAALKSASWGLPQLMGEYYNEAGFSSVDDMVEAFCENEYNQLKAELIFIKNKAAMYHALQVKDWPTFARLYNGPGYAANEYDKKLAEAYQKYKSK